MLELCYRVVEPVDFSFFSSVQQALYNMFPEKLQTVFSVVNFELF